MEQQPERASIEAAIRKSAPAGLLIRAARPEDAEALAAMANLPGFVLNTYVFPHETADDWRKRVDASWSGAPRLAALLDGRMVGSAALTRQLGRRLHAAEVGIGVHDDFRGRGIGRALLAALVEAADRWLGLKRLELTVFVDNTPAIRLYESFGFEVEGTLRDYAFREGAFADVFAMARIVR